MLLEGPRQNLNRKVDKTNLEVDIQNLNNILSENH